MDMVTLIREATDDQGTRGVMVVRGHLFSTLELPWRDNVRELSSIPPGLYDCRLKRSPRFGLVYQVCDVPGRGEILIHGLNFAGDRRLGWDTHSHGCIGLGMKGVMVNTCGKPQKAVLFSRPSVARFMSLMGNAPFTLEIRNAYPDSVAV